MRPRDRVMAALVRRSFDRLPIKHLAVAEVDRRLSAHFGVSRNEDLIDRLGHDFREIRPVYRGPDFGPIDSEHGIISAVVLGRSLMAQRPHELADIDCAAGLEGVSFDVADLPHALRREVPGVLRAGSPSRRMDHDAHLRQCGRVHPDADRGWARRAGCRADQRGWDVPGDGYGGLIFGPSHQIQADAPTENILAMYEAAGGIQ